MADGLCEEIQFWEECCETYPPSKTMDYFECVVLFSADGGECCDRDGPEHPCYDEGADDYPWVGDADCGVFVREKGGCESEPDYGTYCCPAV